MSQKDKSAATGSTTLRAKAELAQESQNLRVANARLTRSLYESRKRNDDLIGAVRSAVSDAASGLLIPPVSTPKRLASTKTRGDEEKALLVLSDLQLGKQTPSYTSDVAAERVSRMGRKASILTDIMRNDHPVKECRLYLLGDIVEGEIIFPHQAFQIDSSLFMQLKNGVEIVVNLIRQLLVTFERVHVVGVIGNHGRLHARRGPSYNPETNADRMLYEWARDLLRAETRVTWNLPYMKNERAWYAVDYPFESEPFPREGHGILLFHGDQIPGSASHSVATVAKHIYGWASGAVREPFDYAIYGHWHTRKSYRFNRFVAWCNGTVESDNTFAQETLAAGGAPPEQLMMFAHPERGITAEYWLDLSKD